jgi:hypothetical protein
VTSRPRLLALGASNLARGFGALVGATRAAWGGPFDVVSAFGPGRSYGLPSALLGRRLPAILDCGIWRALEAQPPARTLALVTDVGNDILYEAAPERILEWVEEAVVRVRRHADEVAIAGLPLARIRRLSAAGFLFFRSVLVPQCRLSHRVTVERSEAVDAALRALAERHGARFVPLPLDWYGADPVHVRASAWMDAWGTIAGFGAVGARGSAWETARLFLMRPAERSWLGLPQRARQPGLSLPGGVTVAAY